MRNTALHSRSDTTQLIHRLPCAPDQFLRSTNLQNYAETLGRKHKHLFDVGSPKGQGFEWLGAQRATSRVAINLCAVSGLHLRVGPSPMSGFNFNVAGRAHMRIEGRRHTLLPEADAFFIDHGDLMVDDEGGAGCILLFDPSALAETMGIITASDDLPRLPRAMPIGPDLLVRRGFLKTVTSAIHLAMTAKEHVHFLSDAAASDLVLRSVALVISEALKLRERTSTPGDAARGALRARAYIHERLLADITLSELERAAGVSRRTLQLQFQKHFGMSPMQYLRDQRLLVARDMLSKGEMSVTDIALACGFTHLSQFSAIFRERFGVRPSEIARVRH